MKRFNLVLRNGNVFLKNKFEKTDIGILGSKIDFIGNLSDSVGEASVDLTNLNVLPGCIDSQVHFREPGLTHKEDLSCGTKGAVLGGITSIFEMPNTKPTTTSSETFQEKILIANEKAYCNFAFFIGASKESINELNELEKIPGCCGIKIFMGSSTGNLLVPDDDNIKKILSTGTKIVAVHSEDEYRLRDRKSIIEKKNATVYDHEVWRDPETAVKSTKRLLKIANMLNRKIHILHISTAQEVPILKKYKHIATCEVTPQHLFFNSPDCYNKLGTLAQMNPPIRGIEHNKALWNALSDGVFDIVGSDHAPHTLEEKKMKYPLSPSGMVGVQTLLPIMLNFVNQKKLTIENLVKLTSTNPAKIFGAQNKGEIKVGNDADFSIVDLHKEKIIKNKWIASKSGWTPYDGIKVKGWPIFTIINGNIVMREDEILASSKGKPITFI